MHKMETVSISQLNPNEQGALQMKPYSYQLEMHDHSLRQNTIVVMPTGSGKTFVAIMRMQSELQRCPPNQQIWFLAPSKALADQQHQVIKAHIPQYNHLMLTGEDGVDKWSDERTWVNALNGNRIIVATPRVLLDALDNAFVLTKNIALIVFDECHNCVKSSDMNRITERIFSLSLGQAQPHILGLTASPGQEMEMSAIKKSMRATIQTPRQTREDLIRRTNPPSLTVVNYDNLSDLQNITTPYSSSVALLKAAIQNYDLDKDPWIIELRKDPTSKALSDLETAFTKKKTFCLDQIKLLHRFAKRLEDELGNIAVKMYLDACLQRIPQTKTTSHYTNEERKLLHALLTEVTATTGAIPQEQQSRSLCVSAKVKKVVTLLQQNHSGASQGIVFVETRPTAVLLSRLLQGLLSQQGLLRVGCFTGTSTFPDRRSNLFDITNTKQQKQDLEDFRTGQIQLMVSTSVLEEGIDIPALSTVISFEGPKTLIAFVQRRGRARQNQSRYYVLLPFGDPPPKDWQRLEQEMIDIYQKEEHERAQVLERETIDEDCDWEMIVKPTGARLTFENATQRLHHFCQTLHCPLIDARPDFHFSDHPTMDLRRCSIRLPAILDPSLRIVEGSSYWKTEKCAKRDACFHAYEKLYRSGLVDEHLLPMHISNNEDSQSDLDEADISLTLVQPLINPWALIAQKWNTEPLCCTRVFTDDSSQPKLDLYAYMPVAVTMRPFTLYWNETDSVTINVQALAGQSVVSDVECSLLNRCTELLLHSAMPGLRDKHMNGGFVIGFSPLAQLDNLLDWLELNSGSYEARRLLEGSDTKAVGIVRDKYDYGAAYICQSIVPARNLTNLESFINEASSPKPVLAAARFPKRRNLLHDLQASHESRGSKGKTTTLLNPDHCTVDCLPIDLAKSALFIPSITHLFENWLVAVELQHTLLRSLPFDDPELVLTAITAPSALEQTNYNRLEFLGDAVLKFCASIMLMSRNVLWPESTLSRKKEGIISNKVLAARARAAGLDRFIIRNAFTAHKWKPLCRGDFPITSEVEESKDPRAQEQLPTKTLADVVESLIGASFVDKDDRQSHDWCHSPCLENALQCLRIFDPHAAWDTIPTFLGILRTRILDFECRSSPVVDICKLTSYKFRDSRLLQTALTHPSYTLDAAAPTYQRLEFLGDAVLDYLVTLRVYGKRPYVTPGGRSRFRHDQMHTLRTLLANADILAFLCMSSSFELSNDLESGPGRREPAAEDAISARYLWQYMRHASPAVSVNQTEAVHRHNFYKDKIIEALTAGQRYPWVELSRCRAPKFFSDIIESLLGAVYVDSGGFDACNDVLEELGLWSIADRVQNDGYERLHPKEELGIVMGNCKLKYVTNPKDGSEEILICELIIDEQDHEDDTPRDSMSVHQGFYESCRRAGKTRVVGDKGEGKLILETRAAATMLSFRDEIGLDLKKQKLKI